jgi:hypothetical protein
MRRIVLCSPITLPNGRKAIYIPAHSRDIRKTATGIKVKSSLTGRTYEVPNLNIAAIYDY